MTIAPTIRPGWQAGTVTVSTVTGKVVTEAYLYGQLAVLPMHLDQGWTISFAESGLRMSCNGRVFRTAEGAMLVVEDIAPQANDWSQWFENQIPERLGRAFADAQARAEARGDLVPNLCVWSA